MFGSLVGWLVVDCFVGWYSRLAGWLVALLVRWLVALLLRWSVAWLVGWLIALLFG